MADKEEVRHFALKEPIEPCRCPDAKCQVESRLMVKRSNDGTVHNRGCKCRPCLGRRNRKSGLKAQVTAARSMGVKKVGLFMPGNEEDWGLASTAVRIEVKSGAQVRPMATAFEKARKQSEAARSVGDSRPFLMIAKAQPGSKDGIVAFRESDLLAVAYGLASNLGLLVE